MQEIGYDPDTYEYIGTTIEPPADKSAFPQALLDSYDAYVSTLDDEYKSLNREEVLNAAIAEWTTELEENGGIQPAFAKAYAISRLHKILRNFPLSEGDFLATTDKFLQPSEELFLNEEIGRFGVLTINFGGEERLHKYGDPELNEFSGGYLTIKSFFDENGSPSAKFDSVVQEAIDHVKGHKNLKLGGLKDAYKRLKKEAFEAGYDEETSCKIAAYSIIKPCADALQEDPEITPPYDLAGEIVNETDNRKKILKRDLKSITDLGLEIPKPGKKTDPKPKPDNLGMVKPLVALGVAGVAAYASSDKKPVEIEEGEEKPKKGWFRPMVKWLAIAAAIVAAVEFGYSAAGKDSPIVKPAIGFFTRLINGQRSDPSKNINLNP